MSWVRKLGAYIDLITTIMFNQIPSLTDRKRNAYTEEDGSEIGKGGSKEKRGIFNTLGSKVIEEKLIQQRED